MNFDITFEGRTTIGADYTSAVELGYPSSVAGAALKEAARKKITDVADAFRSQLASRSASKLAEYRLKEEIARDPASASEPELALIDREAAARGMDRAALLGVIAEKADSFRRTSLLVAAMEAEAVAAVLAVPDDDPQIGNLITDILTAANEQAQTALVQAKVDMGV